MDSATRCRWLSLPLAFGVAGLNAWAAGSRDFPGQQLIFRSGVDSVRLDLVVTDRAGQPITDLTPSEVSIRDEGRPQRVATLELIAAAVTEPSVVPGAQGVVSNTPSASARQWVLLIDDLHIIEAFVVHTQRVMREFLSSLPHDDSVAVVFVGRSDLSMNFSTDREAQLKTVERVRSALGFAPDAADDVDERSRFRMAGATADVLKNIAANVRLSPYSRTAVVYVSEGMTYRRGFENSKEMGRIGDVFFQIDSALDQLQMAGVPVYAIDPRGVPDCTAVRRGCGGVPARNIQAQQTLLREIAEATGGLAFVNQSDVLQAVRAVVKDNATYYLVSFHPEPLVRDGKFRTVTVRVSRPGVRVRAQAGYWAPEPDAPGRRPTPALDDVLAATEVRRDLPLTISVAQIAPARGGTKALVTVDISVPPAGSGDVSAQNTLDVLIAAANNEGSVIVSARRSVSLLAASSSSGAHRVVLNEVLDVPRGPIVVRIAAMERLNRLAGTVSMPIDVIDRNEEQLQIGSLILGRGDSRGTPGPRLDDLVPFQPTADRVFRTADSLHLFARILPPVSVSDGVFTVDIRSGSVTRPVATGPIAELGGGTVNVPVSLAGLQAGMHVLRLAARVPGHAPAERTLRFEIR